MKEEEAEREITKEELIKSLNKLKTGKALREKWIDKWGMEICQKYRRSDMENVKKMWRKKRIWNGRKE